MTSGGTTRPESEDRLCVGIALVATIRPLESVTGAETIEAPEIPDCDGPGSTATVEDAKSEMLARATEVTEAGLARPFDVVRGIGAAGAFPEISVCRGKTDDVVWSEAAELGLFAEMMGTTAVAVALPFESVRGTERTGDLPGVFD